MQVDDPVSGHLRITARQESALARIGIRTVRDLLFHFPARYEDLGGLKSIRDLVAGEKATVIAEIAALKAEKTWRRKLRIAEGVARDATGLVNVVWFNQPYVAHILRPGMRVRLSGKVSRSKSGVVLANPIFEPLGAHDVAPRTGDLVPVYPETYGVTSRWLRYHIERLLGSVKPPPDPIPPGVLERYHLPGLGRALRAIHFPKALGEAEASRKRFAFEEVFIIQLDRERERRRNASEPAAVIQKNEEVLSRFIASLPFALTSAQERAIAQILKDVSRPHPMARLLEGDVGSGKTVVGAAAALEVVSAGHQVAYLAPTEILARQHFEEFGRRLAPFRVRIGLVTSSEARKFPSKVNPKTSTHISKSQLRRWCASGEIQILIGTHALIENRITFKKLALVIVDEQHRFGVRQRKAATKGGRPHFLSMSATPIPRTLALTIYGDLDLTVLDEMPPGREPVQTRIVPPRERERTYQFIREEVGRGGQVFVVCPRIEERAPETDDRESALRSPAFQQRLEWGEVKSVKAEFKKLSQEVFPDLRIGMVHGRLKPKEKEDVMRTFKHRGLDILVSTSVVEVGVDVPNASIMMIEGGERFGLAQLHQLRGRVGRGSRASHCFVFTTMADHLQSRRLKILQDVKTGFELAEHDLQFRGPGELSGSRQWGISDVGMDALRNLKMVEAARTEARALIAKDPDLKNYPLLKERVDRLGTSLHFE